VVRTPDLAYRAGRAAGMAKVKHEPW
jgi:hypothetical protein